MFVASYNKKYIDKAVTIDTPSGTGYTYNDALYQDNSLPSNDSVTSGTAQSNIYNHEYCYWLACPGSNDGYYVRYMDYYSACVDYASYNYNASIGVRPVVCLNSGVTLTRKTDGTFTIN